MPTRTSRRSCEGATTSHPKGATEPEVKDAADAMDLIGPYAEMHGPFDWRQQVQQSRLGELVQAKQPVHMMVLAADIRKSTTLMKEAVDPYLHARAIVDFVRAAERYIRGVQPDKSGHGWFDRFTGDGFLAYWICDEPGSIPWTADILKACHNLFIAFQDKVTAVLKANSYNWPYGVGLSFGLDAGPTHLVAMEKPADTSRLSYVPQFELVGRPVVGAVRMVSEAKAFRILVNVYLGEAYWRNKSELERDDVGVRRVWLPTKEYPLSENSKGQEAYELTLRKTIGIEFPD